MTHTHSLEGDTDPELIETDGDQLELAERTKVSGETALTAGEAQLPMP